MSEPNSKSTADSDSGSDRGSEQAGAASPQDPGWEKLDLAGLRARLVEVKGLLEQALAMGIAQDMAHLDALSELDQRNRENPNAASGRRRYR